MEDTYFAQDFIVKEFEYNGARYKVAMTPELYPDDDDLDFTGTYLVLLVSSASGTNSFEMIPDLHKRWETEPAGVDPGLIDELDKIIQASRGN